MELDSLAFWTTTCFDQTIGRGLSESENFICMFGKAYVGVFVGIGLIGVVAVVRAIRDGCKDDE